MKNPVPMIITSLNLLSAIGFGDCAQTSDAWKMKFYTEVFIGQIDDLEIVPNPHKSGIPPVQKIKFNIWNQFKGKDRKIIEVYSTPGTSVSPNFVKGKDLYLIFAKTGEGGHLWAGGCATANISNWVRSQNAGQ